MRAIQSANFIDEIRKREAIWNSNIPQFKDKCLKRHLWDEICTIFRKKFSDADYTVKVDIRRSFQNQWRNIKDCYRKYLRHKRNNPGSNEKEYVYADRLRFLDPVFKILSSNQPTAPTIEQCVIVKQEDAEWSMNMESGEDEQDDIELLDNDHLVDSNDHLIDSNDLYLNVDPFQDQNGSQSSGPGFGVNNELPIGQPPTSNDQYKPALPESTYDQQKSFQPLWEREDSLVEPPRKKVCLERTTDKHRLKAESTFNRLDHDNDDLNFFLSLMPVVRPLALEEKLKFRMDVMKTCLDYHRKHKRSAAHRIDHNVRFLVVPPEDTGSNTYESARQTSQATPIPTSDTICSTAKI